MTKMGEIRFSGTTQCGHCLNSAPMEIVASYSHVIYALEIHPGYNEDVIKIYEVLKCPACFEITLQEYVWHDFMDPGDENIVILYPKADNNEIPSGLPENISKAFIAAQKVKTIDANAFAVLIGRVLEMVCQDRNAKGRNLSEQLQDLAKKNEIPNKLVMVAKNLRDFRNIGAHAGLGELTKEEVPILNALCNAVLEYVYTAPYLADHAEQRVNQFKLKRKV